MSDNKCPCKDCITYAMCRAEVRGMVNPNVSQLGIRKKCEPLLNYLRISGSKCESGNELFIDTARRAFGLERLWWPH